MKSIIRLHAPDCLQNKLYAEKGNKRTKCPAYPKRSQNKQEIVAIGWIT